jgi:hypothetical protein
MHAIFILPSVGLTKLPDHFTDVKHQKFDDPEYHAPPQSRRGSKCNLTTCIASQASKHYSGLRNHSQVTEDRCGDISCNLRPGYAHGGNGTEFGETRVFRTLCVQKACIISANGIRPLLSVAPLAYLWARIFGRT